MTQPKTIARSKHEIPSSLIDSVSQRLARPGRDGYLIAQEYLPAAAKGDTRLFLMNGIPLQYKGKEGTPPFAASAQATTFTATSRLAAGSAALN